MSETKITVRDNGNLKVEGPITVYDAAGAAFPVPEGSVIFLCRCGHSAAKPFCDGSHRGAAFESAVRAPAAE